MKTDRTQRRRKLKLRKFPYPYKAALTILSDRHGVQTADEFCLFHRFLNTTAETPKGRGLGLEIGDTFWFYDELNRFSYFDKYSNTPSDQASLIRDYYASGYIDSLHTWGDFTNTPFERKYAQWAVDEVTKQGMRLPIWVNHGNVKNTHNINRGVSHHQGALPSSSSFHLDLLLQTGFQILWRFLTPVIGQDRPLSFGEHMEIGKESASSDAVFVAKRLIKRTIMGTDRVIGGVLGQHDRNADNHLLKPAMLDNGRWVYEFRRFNNHPANIWHGIHVPDLLRQIRADVIEELIRSEGYMVVYNHLEYGDFYHPDIVGVLTSLRRREEEGDVWVTTMSKMVKYNWTFHQLRWEEHFDDEQNLSVTIAPNMHDPIFGNLPVARQSLEGVTFMIPQPVNSIRFKLGPTDIQHEVFMNGTMEKIVGFPIQRLTFPE